MNMTYDQIPDGSYIAGSATETGRQSVYLEKGELVCYACNDLNERLHVTKRTPVSEAMKAAVAKQYAKTQTGKVSMGA